MTPAHVGNEYIFNIKTGDTNLDEFWAAFGCASATVAFTTVRRIKLFGCAAGSRR